MAQLALQAVGQALNPVNFTAAAGGGDTVKRHDNSFLIVRNGGGSPVTVTLDTPGTTHGLAIADEGVTVAAGATAFIGTNDSVFVHSNDDRIHVAYSGVTSVTVAQVAA